MDATLTHQNPHWSGQPYTGLIERNVMPKLINQLKLREIQVISGIRRSGKSSIFKLLINHLMIDHPPTSILVLNLDDPHFSEAWENPTAIDTIIMRAEALTGRSFDFLFLDEIQNIRHWEKWVKSAYDQNRYRKIGLTGSNAQLLTSQDQHALTGRVTIEQAHPFSLDERLRLQGITTALDRLRERPQVLQSLQDALTYGGLPEVCRQQDPSLKRELLRNYLDGILLNDCLLQHRIRDAIGFRHLAHYLLTHSSQPLSYHKLAVNLKLSDATAKQYTHLLKDAYLIESIHKWDPSLKKSLAAPEKIYTTDLGLTTIATTHTRSDLGARLESWVYQELRKCLPEATLTYATSPGECDFVIDLPEVTLCLQVCAELHPDNQDREMRGLIQHIDRTHRPVQAFILTLHQRLELPHNIQAIPCWQWFQPGDQINLNSPFTTKK